MAMLLCLLPQVPCGSRLSVWSHIMGRMSWYCNLQNRIPEFNPMMALEQDQMTACHQKCPAWPEHTQPRVTWGMIKTLSDDAKRTLNQQQISETPKIFLAAIISQLNANSMMLLCCVLILEIMLILLVCSCCFIQCIPTFFSMITTYLKASLSGLRWKDLYVVGNIWKNMFLC